MDPVEAADTLQETAEETRAADDRFRRRAGLTIGVLAMLLAITSLGGDNATKEMINANIQASDTWAFYQAKNIRQTSNQLAADELEALLISQPNLAPEARAELQKRIDGYKATVARYESEPATGEGKQELQARAQQYEAQRAHAQRQDPNFDYSQALFQIAIVVGSVSILTASRPLLRLSLLLGGLAALLMLNGYALLVDLPFD
jgi:uncharacterized protein DUF4337